MSREIMSNEDLWKKLEDSKGWVILRAGNDGQLHLHESIQGLSSAMVAAILHDSPDFKLEVDAHFKQIVGNDNTLN